MIKGFLKKYKPIIIILSITFLFGVFLWWILIFEFYNSHSSNESNRQALIKIRELIKIGDSYESVLQLFWANDLRTLDLSINVNNRNQWIIKMQPEILETDWQLFVFFEDNKVIGHRILTADGPPPSNAPENVGRMK